MKRSLSFFYLGRWLQTLMCLLFLLSVSPKNILFADCSIRQFLFQTIFPFPTPVSFISHASAFTQTVSFCGVRDSDLSFSGVRLPGNVVLSLGCVTHGFPSFVGRFFLDLLSSFLRLFLLL